jgi:hypothetical protein
VRKALCVLVIAAMPAWSADKDGSYLYSGPTCGQFVAAEGVNKFHWGWWMNGYLTAYNALTPDTVSILGSSDLQSAQLWMEKWCRANPLRTATEGMLELTTELYPRRYRNKRDAGR